MARQPIIPPPAGVQYRRFSLTIQHTAVALLPPEHEFIINTESGHYMLVSWNARHIVADGVFSMLELPLVLALLRDWPSYVPSQKLLQAITDQPPEEIAEVLDITHNAAVEPLQRIVEGCQERFHQTGIKIEDIQGEDITYGYKLSLYTAAADR